jgi:phenylpropionate dioxygenase-like ring-hydroxylating dioxygenase large terminal subunit
MGTATKHTTVADWVRPDEGRVLARVYSDPDLFQAELDCIWKRVWLYAGHTSEVPAPGDYLTRTVGTVPLLITREADSGVAVLVNVCTHRGNALCSKECGNASSFRCAYHGWTFRNDGDLIGVPYPNGYDGAFDKQAKHLHRPRRVEVYRGFIFVSYAADGPSLAEHLGNASEALDRFVDVSPTGELLLTAGFSRTRVEANWKIYVENASDNYHASFVHASGLTNEAQRKILAAVSGNSSQAVVRALGNGHTDVDLRPEQRTRGAVLRTGNANSVLEGDMEEYVRALSQRVGAARAKELLDDGPPTLFIFPNLFVMQQEVRRLEPVSVRRCHQYEHPALLGGVPESINAQRLARHEAAYGPAGFFMPDDLEVFSRNQRALEAVPDLWASLTRGLHREQADEHGVVFSHVTDETGIRSMWRNYLKLMAGVES